MTKNTAAKHGKVRLTRVKINQETSEARIVIRRNASVKNGNFKIEIRPEEISAIGIRNKVNERLYKHISLDIQGTDGTITFNLLAFNSNRLPVIVSIERFATKVEKSVRNKDKQLIRIDTFYRIHINRSTLTIGKQKYIANYTEKLANSVQETEIEQIEKEETDKATTIKQSTSNAAFSSYKANKSRLKNKKRPSPIIRKKFVYTSPNRISFYGIPITTKAI